MNTILILHGWGSSSKNWDKVKELLEKDGLRVLVPDLPGFGETPAPLTAWSVNDYVQWVKDFSGKNNLDQFFLLGHSFGGRIAVKFAVKYPEKLRGLILASAAGVTPRPKIKIAVFNFFSRIGNLIFSLPFLASWRFFIRRFVYFLGGMYDYQFIQVPVMREVFKLTIEENLTDYLSLITTKTLIIWGNKDKITPLRDGYLIHDQIKGSKLEIIKEVGHDLNLKTPEILANKIIKFY